MRKISHRIVLCLRASVLVLLLLLLTGCKPAEPDIRLYILDGGRLEGDLVRFAQGEEYAGRIELLADMAFLIRHPKGDLLWDTGIDDAIHDPESDAAKNRPTMSMPLTIESQLADLGMTPGRHRVSFHLPLPLGSLRQCQ